MCKGKVEEEKLQNAENNSYKRNRSCCDVSTVLHQLHHDFFFLLDNHHLFERILFYM